ncbi:MAG: hypothetical protein WCJ94_06180 [bacterium]
MKKLSLGIILFFIIFSSIHAESINVKTGKASYLRYELIDMYCDYVPTIRKSFLNLNNIVNLNNPAAVTCTAKVFFNNHLVQTIGATEEILLHYNAVSKSWSGSWPIPWNPNLGTYKAVITLDTGAKKISESVNFEITKRQTQPLPKGFCVMNIEPGDSIITKVPGATGKPVKIWENYILWAKFMGASALWHCVGQSQIWNTFKPATFPWDKTSVSQMSSLGNECHKNDIKYGAWITSFVVLGNRKDLSPYRQSVSYDAVNNLLKPMIYVSILDEKRREDLIDLLKKMQADPAIDYLGMDYMRTDFGGLEYADSFVNDMPLLDIPRDWKAMTEEDKMFWLGRKLEIDKSPAFLELWDWWRAHKMATVIVDIKKRAGITKPMWVFSLTWRQGKEHGQDPLMFIDAGVDINSGMYYSVEHDTYPSMLKSWKDYLKQGQTNLCAGQCVDWNLLGRTYRPSGPEEHYLRQKLLIDTLLPVNPSLGLFWHDLTRAFKGSKGPYSTMEWAVAGATSFSYLRTKQDFFPFESKWELPDSVKIGEVFTIDIQVKNKGNVSMDYSVKLLKVSNLEMFGDIVQKFILAPGEIKTLTFQVKALESDYNKDHMQMIAYMLQSQGLSTQQRYFDFKYIEVK